MVAAARLSGAEGRIARIVNTLEWISFNFGPTLLEWLERRAPDTYQALLDADRLSTARLGHGNAIAMPYHHAILPLSSRRDKVTEVRWGIADFRRRFGRDPEGMWLPETAVDLETLEVLAGEGIRFTILAPSQVERCPAEGMPGVCRLPGGGSIALCIYDGAMSNDVAFGALLRDGHAWARRLLSEGFEETPPRLVSVATDGETYGHHHKFGEMGLATMLEALATNPAARVENFAAFLARHPAEEEVTLVSPSAWSCAHGVERWRSDCGCRMAPDRPTQQRWRTPLRMAVDWLTAELHAAYDREAPAFLADPARAREEYGSVVGTDADQVRRWVAEAALRPDDAAALVRAGELLELVRGALRTLTSCAWFFDDIGGIEAVQVLRYAAHAIELAGPRVQARLELGFTELLAPAESNDSQLGSGRDIYFALAKPARPAFARIAAGLTALRQYSAGGGLAAWELEGTGPGVTAIHRRTGRRYTVQVELEQRGLGLRAAVAGSTLAEPLTFPLADLPERARQIVTAALRTGLVNRRIAAEGRARLLAGEPLREVTHDELVRAMAVFAAGPTAETALVLTDLLELYESLGRSAPLELQTTFYKLWTADPARREADVFVALARRLGFEVAPH